MKRICLILIILSSFKSNGQKPIAAFLLRVLPDHSWTLYLYKDQTYQYKHWSGWDTTRTIDHGTFKLENDTITFFSAIPDSSMVRLNKGYTLKKIWKNQLKESHTFSDWIISRKRPAFFRKHLALIGQEEPVH